MSVFKRMAAVASAGLVVGVAVAPAHAEIGPGADPATMTAAPLPTWQTNGTVWDMAVVNGVVYVGGNFTSVRPPGAAPGTNEVTRNRLAAFNAQTGDLLSWTLSATSAPWPTTDSACTPLGGGQAECATVWAVTPTPKGNAVVVGGDFQALNGSVRAGLASFSACTLPTPTSTSCAAGTGVLNTTFKPSVSGRIYTVAATNSSVYIGGLVTRASGLGATGVAALDYPAGTAKSGFTPPPVVKGSGNGNTGVRKLVVTEDGSRLIVGGGYDSLNGRAIHGLQAVDGATGQSAPWEFTGIDKTSFITGLKIYDNVVYTTGDSWGSPSEGIIALDVANGRLRWSDGCRGASHSMAMADNGVIYVGSHSHDCQDMEGGFPEQYNGYPLDDSRRYTLRAEIPNGSPSARLLPWSPRSNDGNGARAMQFDDVNGDLWLGGELTTIDSAPQQGLTRFSSLNSGGLNRKPLKPNPPLVTSTRVTSGGVALVDIAIQAVEDPDSPRLTYELIRDDQPGSPIFTTTARAMPWALGWIHYQDSVAPGSKHTYDVRVTDPLTATNRSDPRTITAAGASTSLANQAKADGAATQYSFESRVNGLYVDGVSGKTATPGGSGVTTSAGNGFSGNAVTFNGSQSARSVVVEGSQAWTTRQFSLEAMFKTNTRNGGSMLAFGSTNSTSDTSPNNMGLYMDNAGRLNFGLQPHAVRANPFEFPTTTARPAVTTSAGYADNAWHHVVATFQPNGSRIYVDGNLAAESTTMVWTMPINGYLRMGAEWVQFFPNAPTANWWTGSLDEVAMYKYPLSPAQVKAHSGAVFQTTNPDPAPATPTGLRVTGTTTSSVSLAWDAVSGATSYVVSRDGTDLPGVTGTSLTDTGRASGTTYSYTVRARNAAGFSSPSAPVKGTTDAVIPQPPATPTGLRVTGTTSTTVSLAWDAVSGATSYVVSRGGTALPAVSGTSLTDSGRTPATSYTYTVLARNAAGSSKESGSVTAKTTAAQVVDYSVSGDVWRANDTGADLGTGWRAVGYNDSAWKSGPSQLGYGDGDEATVLKWGADPNAKPITNYFRRTFDAGASVADVTQLTLRALIDDAAVVYLNGTEIWRFNLPPGTITYTTRASRYIAGAEENLWRTITLPKSALVAGQNTLSVEVHQDLPSSSDVTFDLELRPVR
jgi:chitodextrinase